MAEETVPAAPLGSTQVETGIALAASPEPAGAPSGEPVAEAEASPAPAEVAAPSEPEAAAPAETPVEGAAADPAAQAAAEPGAEGEAKPEAEAPKAPAYTDFKMPEGVTADTAVLGAYTNILGKYGLSQEAGQELLDFHANTLKQAQEAMDQRQRDVFAETRAGWVKDFDKGAGNKRDTILNDAKWAITDLVKDTKQREALWNVLAFTGAGDHPAVINAFASAAKRLRERAAPPPGLPQNGAKSGSAPDRRYGRTPS